MSVKLGSTNISLVNQGSTISNRGYLGVRVVYGSDMTSELTTSDLFFRFDMEEPTSYVGSGTVINDMIGGLTLNMSSGSYNPTEKSFLTTGELQYLNIEAPYLTRPSGDYTFCVYVRINSKNPYGNPGFWRDGSSSSNFNIFSTVTGRQWLRLNGTNFDNNAIASVPDGVYNLVTYVVKSGFGTGYVQFYINDTKIYDVSHSLTPDLGLIQRLCYQQEPKQNVWGDFKSMLFYSRSLSETEIANNYFYLKNSYGH